MRGRLFVLGLLLCQMLPAIARGQGLLLDDRPDHAFRLPRPMIFPPHPIPRPVPPPPSPTYKIKQLAMQANLVDQVAKVQVTQSFVNTGSVQMEVAFVFPLPYDGAIDRLYDFLFKLIMEASGSYWVADVIFYGISGFFWLSYILLSRRLSKR